MARVAKINRIMKVTLELDDREFKYLCTILGRTGGSPENSLRGAADSIVQGLAAGGVNYREYLDDSLVDVANSSRGSIYFKDEE